MIKKKKAFANALVLFHEVMGPVHENLRPIFDHLYSLEDEEIEQKIVLNFKGIIHKELYRFETILSLHESSFLCGKQISLVDLSFIPTLAHLVRFGYSFKSYPYLSQYYDKLLQRDSIKKNMAFRMGYNSKTSFKIKFILCIILKEHKNIWIQFLFLIMQLLKQ